MRLVRHHACFFFSVVCFLAPNWSHAISPQAAVKVDVGFNGVCKAGHWTPVRISTTVDFEQSQEIQINAIDGDGMLVKFSEPAAKLTADNPIWRYVRLGPIASPLSVFRGDSRLNVAQPDSLPSSKFLIVNVSNNLTLDSAALKHTGIDRNTISVVPLATTLDLPDHWIGYEAVDLLVFELGSDAELEQMTAAQIGALRRWVEQGGRLVIFPGKEPLPLLEAPSPFADFVPGQVQRVGTSRTTSGPREFSLEQTETSSNRFLLSI